MVVLVVAVCFALGNVLAEVRGTAVVELFTWEGCSSCPPAEALLNNLARDATENAYFLAFQVDYWNRLGWVDSFIDSDYSARQRRYARAHRAMRAYTPQIILDGRRAFVGSDRNAASEVIAEGVSEVDQVPVSVSAAILGDAVTVRYSLQGPSPGKVASVALFEDGLRSDVTRGANSGRQLLRARVDRGFELIPFGDESRWTTLLAILKKVDRRQLLVVA